MSSPSHTTLRLSRAALERALDRFHRSLRDRKPETRGTYQRALREFARWHRTDGRVRFRTEDIRRYKKHLSGRRGLAPVSVSTYLTALRQFCDFLVRSRLLRENPARTVRGNERPRKHSRDVLTLDEVRRLLEEFDAKGERGLRDYAIVRLMLGCGLSEIELIRADRGDLTLAAESSSLLVQGKGKSAKDTAVILPPDVREAIEAYLAVRGPGAPDQPLFTSAGNRTRGRRMTTRGIRDRINGSLERLGIRRDGPRRISPYSLRHTAAMLMAQSGASADELRERLRLGSLATAEYYLHKTTTDS
jgi:site-specific recombinase XerC